jgi:DnaJ-class molecular chaperone
MKREKLIMINLVMLLLKEAGGGGQGFGGFDTSSFSDIFEDFFGDFGGGGSLEDQVIEEMI